MNYKFDWVSLSHISEIKDEWTVLEKGPDMTYFQTYDWYNMLVPFTPCSYPVDCGYVLISKEDDVILIAPLWIIKYDYLFVNKRGVYIIGRKGCTDYLNLIYRDFDPLAVDFMIEQVRARYKSINFVFENILETTKFNEYLRYVRGLNPSVMEPCGFICLNDSFAHYFSSLSKKTRQNIRTAYNRLNNDGISYKIEIDDKDADIKRCDSIRNERLEKKKKFESSYIIRLKTAIYKILDINFPECIQHQSDVNSHILSVYCNDDLCMFFCYGIDKIHKTIVLMTAGIDVRYKRYSLGMVGLAEFINYLIEHTDIAYLDFLRGGEFYKYALGAQDRNINTYIVFR